MNLTTRTLLALGLGLCLSSAQALSLKDSDTLDKLDALDRGDQQAVLNQAKQAAKEWKFDDAERLLKQAKVIAYNPAAVKEVEALIATNKQAKVDKEEKERQAAEDVRKLREKFAALKAIGSESSSPSSGGGKNCGDFIRNYGASEYCKTGSCSFSDFNVNYFCNSIHDGYAAAAFLRNRYPGKLGENLASFADFGSMPFHQAVPNDAVYSANTNHSSSFEARKEWIIYYLNGYTLK